MGTDEKIILLAALFQEIGKFAHLCGVENDEENCSRLKTQLDVQLRVILGDQDADKKNTEAAIKKFNDLVSNLNNGDTQIKGLSEAMRLAHRLACGPKGSWSPKYYINNIEEKTTYLTSIFQTVTLAAEKFPKVKYINQKVLSDPGLSLISETDIESNSGIKYTKKDFLKFIVELNTILKSYQKIADFPSFYNLLLNHFEHYFWCLPVDNNPDHTGISLFNYVKDVAGLAHAVILTENSKNLLLINVELVGKVKYMSNIVNTKPAKILRGRSIFVQVVTRIVVSILLKHLELTEASIVMHAAGKILIVAPGEESFKDKIKEVTKTIEETLSKNFLYEISFGIGVTEFTKEPDDEWSFGDVVEASNIQQQNKWQKLFYDDFYNPLKDDNFVQKGDYVTPKDDDESDKMKCQVTDKPIIDGRKKEIVQRYKEDGRWVESKTTVDLQVFNEFRIGDIVPKETIVISVNEKNNCFEVEEPKRLSVFSGSPDFKIIINPKHSDLMSKIRNEAKSLKGAAFLHVSNYVTMIPNAEPDDEEMIPNAKPDDEKIVPDAEPIDEEMVPDEKKKTVMDFETMTKKNIGGEFLTMIKGDIDNFGIILSCGLKNHSVSSHSTLSSQLKYFFSVGLNKLLSEWCGDYGNDDHVVYCVYSGGDDIFFVTTQSYALELVRNFNEKFTEFTCSNPEIHISYSFTNFKHNTPIRIVSDFADNNQKAIKRKYKNELPKGSKTIPPDFFLSQNDKAGSIIFNTPVKNCRLDEILKWTMLLTKWIGLEDNPPLTKGAIRYIFDLSVMMTDYFKTKSSESLYWHPKLTYYVKRNINLDCDSLTNHENQKFDEFITEMLKIEVKAGRDIKEILTPLMSAVILRTRT